MSKITTNNSAKKLRILKYSLLASISAGAIIAVPFEGVASSKDTYQDIMAYNKELNRASSGKRISLTKKGRESLKSNESSQDIEDFYKNSSPAQHLEKERYTPTPREKTSPDNFNNSGDETFVTANNTLPSTLSTSFDQMEYKYMALSKDVQTKMDKIDQAKQSQGNNKKSLKKEKRSLSKKQKIIVDAANIEEQIIELKKADSSPREENKIKKLGEKLKNYEQKVAQAYSDIEKSFNTLKLETETTSDFDTSSVQQEPNSQSDFKPAQASTPKKPGVFSPVDKKTQKQVKKIRKNQAAEAYKAAKNKNNIEEARTKKDLLIITLEMELDKKKVLLNNQESEQQFQDKLNQLERIKKILEHNPESLETTRERIGRIGSHEDKTIAEKKLLKIEKKQKNQEDFKLKILEELSKKNPNYKDIDKYSKKVEMISGEIKTEIGQITFPPQPPARNRSNTNNGSIPGTPIVQRIVDNSEYDSEGYLKPNLPSVQDYLKPANKPRNETSYNRRIEEKLAEAKQIESRINGYQDKIKTNVGFIAANEEDTHIVPKQESQLQPHIEDLGSTPSSSNSSDSDVEIKAQGYSATPLKKYASVHSISDLVGSKEDLSVEFEKVFEAESLNNEFKNIEDLGSTPSSSNSSDSDVEIKAQGYSATPLKKYASVHSISDLVGSKEDLSVEFEKVFEAESLNNEFKTEFKEIKDAFDRVAADINSELETLTAAKGLNDQPNANIGTKTENASDQLLLSTNEHSSLGVSNGREDKPSSSGLIDGGKSEHRLLGVSDGSDDEHGLLALSDGRENENDSLKLKDGDDKRSCLRLKSGEKDEDSFLKLIDSDYDSGIEEDLEYSKPLKKIDAITTIPLPQAVEEVKKSVAAITLTTNQQIQTVQKVTKDSIFTRLDSIAVVKINEDNNAAIAAGDEESPVKRGLWMRTMYGVNNQGRVNNINGYRGINKGGTVGFDVEIDNNIIGIAYSNVHSVFKFKNNNNNDKEIINSHIVSIYGQKELPKNFVLQGLVSASKNFIKNKTTYLFNNTKFKSNVKHRNHSYNAEALLNYNYLATNNIGITPNIGLRYGKSRDGVYNETGISIQEIALATKENNILSGIIGAKTKIPLKNNNLGLTLHSSIEHNFNEKTQRVNRTIQIQGNKFTQNHIIPKQAKTAYNLGGGIIGSVKNTIISLDYNYYLNKRYHSHQGSIKLKVNL